MKTNKKNSLIAKRLPSVRLVKSRAKQFNRANTRQRGQSPKQCFITKASGEKELFDGAKIYRTARSAGADKNLAKDVRRMIEKKIYSDISSNKILNYILSYLNKKGKKVAVKYNLKRAIMKLGPCGYSFEKYVAMILKEYGYQAKINQFIKGYCLTYEIDILAQKDNRIFVVECKYHNSPGSRSDTKVVLYSNARFLDIKKQICQPCKALLVTNTKCTTSAVKYAKCAGMDIISWHYPKGKSLENLIERKKLYPITCFPSLSRDDRNKLIANNVILLKDLLNLNLKKLAQKSGISFIKLQKLKDQAENIY